MQQQNSTYPSNAFGRFWMRLPLVVRASLLGFGVSSLGIGIWMILAFTTPPPWSAMAMYGILILFWMYFRGKWGPTNTQSFRRFCGRDARLNRSVWLWGAIGSLCIFLIVSVGLALTFRVVEFQPEVFKTSSYLNDMPAWWAWPLLIGASLVAGICEEFGYRGYMQKPLETKYGPVVGISITSLVFVAIHLHQAWATGILLQIFGISFMIGYLAYATNSLIPGIVAHVSFDIVNFSYWWSDVAGTFSYKPISMTGVDGHFLLTGAIVVFSLLVFVIAIRKLLRLKGGTVSASSESLELSTT